MPTIAAGSFTAIDIRDGIGNFKDIMRLFIYSSYKATVEANGSACVYDYLYASEVPEEFCKAEYKDFIELDGDKAVRVNNDNTVDFAECLSKLLP